MNVLRWCICFACLACSETPVPSGKQSQKDQVSQPKAQTLPSKPAPAKKAPEFSADKKLAGEQFWQFSSADLNTGKEVNSPPPIRRIDDEHFAVGQFIVNQKEKWIRIKSKVNQQQDVLEYFSCGPRGKLHECVLLSFGLPSHLHLALLLLGAQPGGSYGSEVTISVEWRNAKTGKYMRHPAANFLFDRLKLKKGQNILWSFTGSKFVGGRYQANSDQSLIAVINDSQAVIGVKSIVGNAHKGPKQGFEGNRDTTPAKGTPVDIYVQLVE
jgi:hypothetical protein